MMITRFVVVLYIFAFSLRVQAHEQFGPSSTEVTSEATWDNLMKAMIAEPGNDGEAARAFQTAIRQASSIEKENPFQQLIAPTSDVLHSVIRYQRAKRDWGAARAGSVKAFKQLMLSLQTVSSELSAAAWMAAAPHLDQLDGPTRESVDLLLSFTGAELEDMPGRRIHFGRLQSLCSHMKWQSNDVPGSILRRAYMDDPYRAMSMLNTLDQVNRDNEFRQLMSVASVITLTVDPAGKVVADRERGALLIEKRRKLLLESNRWPERLAWYYAGSGWYYAEPSGRNVIEEMIKDPEPKVSECGRHLLRVYLERGARKGEEKA